MERIVRRISRYISYHQTLPIHTPSYVDSDTTAESDDEDNALLVASREEKRAVKV